MTTPTLRARHDGWTPERQAIFAAAVAGGASIGAAAAAAGMSRRAAYRMRAHPAGAVVAAAWPEPMSADAFAAMFDVALDRAEASRDPTALAAISDRALIGALGRLARR